MPKDNAIEHVFLAETTTREHDLNKEIKKYNEIFNKDIRKDYNLTFETYQSAFRWKGRKLGLVICDEVQDQMTPKYALFHRYNSYEALLCLSATVDRDTEYVLDNGVTITKGFLLDKLCPVCFTYSVEEAIRDNTTRNLVINVIEGYLDYENKTISIGKGKKQFKQTEREFYDYWEKRFQDNIHEEDYEKRQRMMQIIFNKLTGTIYNAEYKVRYARKILDTLKSKSIIFGNSLDSLLKITPNVISSRNKDDKNSKIISDFEKDNIQEIGSFKKLEQGANLPKLDNVIVTSYYSKPHKLIQRIGRLRNDDKVGVVFIFLTRGTREETWYTTMIENYRDETINIYSDINEYLKTIK